MDLSVFSGLNALFTLLTVVTAGIIILAQGRRMSWEQHEASRKEWQDIATRKDERNEVLTIQIADLQREMMRATEKLGGIERQNQFLMQRNIELQERCSLLEGETVRLRADNKHLRAEMRRAGLTLTELPEEG